MALDVLVNPPRNSLQMLRELLAAVDDCAGSVTRERIELYRPILTLL
jgi:hypothetical protein